MTAKLKPSSIWIFGLILASALALSDAISAQQPQVPAADIKQQRHEQLVADTTKLLQLANELKSEVDKSTKDTLSVPVVIKAEEVGKLAKKLREATKP